MGIELRMPNITGTTEREQLTQIRSYLYQIIPQLEWAMNHIDTSVAPNNVPIQTQRVTTNQPSVEDAEVTFNSLKPLIIKSADIVQAYYDEISTRLEGLYVAESDFGTFVEQTSQDIIKSSTDVTQLFTNLQEIDTDIKNINFAIKEVNAHIKTGLLEDGDNLVYGLEVGQNVTQDGNEVFRKFARFTSDRLSFYDKNDREVAYISDYKLYIRNAEITSSLKIGGFVDTVMANGDVVTKWVGGDG